MNSGRAVASAGGKRIASAIKSSTGRSLGSQVTQLSVVPLLGHELVGNAPSARPGWKTAPLMSCWGAHRAMPVETTHQRTQNTHTHTYACVYKYLEIHCIHNTPIHIFRMHPHTKPTNKHKYKKTKTHSDTDGWG